MAKEIKVKELLSFPKDICQKEKMDMAIKFLNTRYGKNVVRRMRDQNNHDFVSTGSLKLDLAISKNLPGGIIRGCIVETFGLESSGKTTLNLSFLKQFQDAKHSIGMVEMEKAVHNFDWEAELGIDVDNMYFAQPLTGEVAMDLVKDMLMSRICEAIMIDSVTGLVDKDEINQSVAKDHMTLLARLMSNSLKQINPFVYDYDSGFKANIFFTNQIRVGNMSGYGNPNVPTGGNSLKFYATYRFNTIAGDKITDTLTTDPNSKKMGSDIIGKYVIVKVVKNKMAPAFREVKIPLNMISGFDRELELFEMATDSGIIELKGSWYSYNAEKLAQGKLKSIEILRKDPKVFETIKTSIIDKYNKGEVAVFDYIPEQEQEVYLKEEEELEKEFDSEV